MTIFYIQFNVQLILLGYHLNVNPSDEVLKGQTPGISLNVLKSYICLGNSRRLSSPAKADESHTGIFNS